MQPKGEIYENKLLAFLSEVVLIEKTIKKKNAFQWDAYRPLVVRVSWGVGGRAWQGGGGCVWWGGMHGRGGLRGRGACVAGGACVVVGGAWPCDLSHHAFDVTCMLSPHLLRPTNSAAPYIVLVGHVTRMPPPLLTESQTGVKT